MVIILCFSLIFNSVSTAFAEEKNETESKGSHISFTEESLVTNKASLSDVISNEASPSDADFDEEGYASTFEELANDEEGADDISTPSDADTKNDLTDEEDGETIASSSTVTEDEENDPVTASTSDATYDNESISTESDIEQSLDDIIVVDTATISEIKENLFSGDGKTITGVSILNPPNKITYLPANTTSINLSGLVLRYTLEDTNGVETYEDVSYGYPFNDWHYGSNHWLEDPSTLGKHTINVSYIGLFGHENYSSGFSVNIDLYVREITNITILDPPTKTNYKGGEKLEMSGLTVRVNYSD